MKHLLCLLKTVREYIWIENARARVLLPESSEDVLVSGASAAPAPQRRLEHNDRLEMNLIRRSICSLAAHSAFLINTRSR